MSKARVPHPTGGDKLTQQHHKEAVNITSIMEKHLKTGVMGMPPRGPGRQSARQPMFVHLSGKSYHEMLCQVQEVQGAFAGLPSRVRRRFANNPEQLLTFLQDPENLPAAIELGLIQEDELPEDKKAQLDLVRESEKAELEEFKEWQRNKRANNPEPELEPDTPAESAGSKRDNSRRKGTS